MEGVHFLSGDPLDGVAKKLLRVNLSDLAAKAAEPYAYFLAVAWSKACDQARRAAFARGLSEDQVGVRRQAARGRYGFDAGALDGFGDHAGLG